MTLRSRIGIALLSAAAITGLGRIAPDDSFLWLLQSPGWAVAFSLFFASSASTLNGIAQEVAYWFVNIGLLGIMLLAMAHLIQRTVSAAPRN